MIEIKEVSKSYNDNLVLERISFTVNKGERCIIIGKSGSGKSVLLRHLIGLELPDEGEVKVDGVCTTSVEFVNVRKKMGMVFQESALFDFMTVGENVGFYPYFNNGVKGEKLYSMVKETLEKVELFDVMEKYPSQLSGGMAKRVAIARTIIYKPNYILYDEPTTGLDPKTASHIIGLIDKIYRETKMTMVMITHDMEIAENMADVMVVLKGNGKWSVYRGEEISSVIDSIKTGGKYV